VHPGAVIDPDELLQTLIAGGYRREEIVEHRGEVARRGAIIDVFASTADVPIRIDLWGDEVDRLTSISVNDQRSTADLAEALIFPARELLPSDAVRERANTLIGTEPWGREQWERLSEGAHFDGMESWLPWLTDVDQLLTDVLPTTGKVILVEPRRMRDRAQELLAEEDDLARALASTWGRDPDVAFPRLHAEPDQLLGPSISAWMLTVAPENPDSPMSMPADGVRWSAMARD
jgi:transcription-repair coupling factor (superfamily II helicase)